LRQCRKSPGWRFLLCFNALTHYDKKKVNKKVKKLSLKLASKENLPFLCIVAEGNAAH
jgi:hypothetical protein